MDILVAKSAGFCFGVSRAVNTVYNKLDEVKLVTYGWIIHNAVVTKDLASRGVRIIERIDEVSDETVVIRSHGVEPEVYSQMEKGDIPFLDCTCPNVKKIHRIVQSNNEAGQGIMIIGDRSHPEVIGINGYSGGNAIIIENTEQAYAFVESEPCDINTPYTLVIQTTFRLEVFNDILEILKSHNLKIKVYNTICKATADRQAEAEEISQKVDIMLIMGDKGSSNTAKLYEICRKNCEKTFLLESIRDLQLNIYSSNVKIGITAGASTPPDIIKEAINFMSDVEKNTQSFEEMLDEALVTLHTGEVVKGIVIHVTSAEISVNLGYKSDGIIPRAEYSDEPNIDLTTLVQPGDEIEVYVLRVNDGDGNVLLSKKRLEMQKGWELIEEAFNNKVPIKGRLVELVKGGMIASIGGARVFVPSSQVTSRYVEDLKPFKGKEFDFNIIEFDRGKRRVVAGRKELAQKEEAEKKQKVFDTLEVGSRVEGTVSRLVNFGAFVDLGGVDGLIHISQMSWGRVKDARGVLSENDKVIVTVLDVDRENSKISLSLKDLNNDPWTRAGDKYIVGDIIEGKVVRMAAFGAFVELEDGIDGLVHVSQISDKHVPKPEDALSIGQIINVKITEVDTQNKRISLSKKEADGVLNQQENDAEQEYEGEVNPVELTESTETENVEADSTEVTAE